MNVESAATLITEATRDSTVADHAAQCTAPITKHCLGKHMHCTRAM